MLLKIWRAYASFIGVLFIVSYIIKHKEEKAKKEKLKLYSL